MLHRMSDFADDAADLEALHRDYAIKYRRAAPQPSGFCLHCDMEILRGVFCSTECREDFERVAKIRHIQGL